MGLCWLLSWPLTALRMVLLIEILLRYDVEKTEISPRLGELEI